MWTKLQNTNGGCAICPCIGCNHELFCAVGHFSFVLWLLKMEQHKIYLVWKTTLLLSTGLLSGLCASGGTLSLSLCLAFFFFNLIYNFSLNNTKSITYYLLDLHGLCCVTPPCHYGICCYVVGFLPLVALNTEGSHTHCNLTLDIWSSVIQALHWAPELQDCHLQMNGATLPYLVALMPLHTCHCDLLGRLRNIQQKWRNIPSEKYSYFSSPSTERSEVRVCFMVSWRSSGLLNGTSNVCQHEIKWRYCLKQMKSIFNVAAGFEANVFNLVSVWLESQTAHSQNSLWMVGMLSLFVVGWKQKTAVL